MEHPCPKCGAAVEDGVPFCKQCRAPQIRVAGFEPEPEVARHAFPNVDESTTATPVILPLPVSRSMQWSRAFPCAALGGGLAFLLALIPFAAFGPAWVAGGALSVMFYRRRVPNALLTPASGALLGAASGGFGFVFSAILLVGALVYHTDDLRKAFGDSVSQLPSRGYDPQAAQQVLELLKTPQGLAFFVAFALFIMFVIVIAGASIGGAWYSAWLRRRARG